LDTTIEKMIRELIERVIELAPSYAIWWELNNPENRQKYQNNLNDHEDFFASTAQAHFLLIAVVLYQLFDKRKGTKSIHNIFIALEPANIDLVKKLRKDVVPRWQIFEKIFDIRGNVYAHLNASLSPEEVFARARLSVNALGDLVGLAEDLIAEIAEVAGVGVKLEIIDDFERRADYARRDLQLILGALSE
jgi:hypothetical protein